MAKKKNDTARERFVRLATQRVNAVVKKVQLIGNLSNRSNYEWTEQDATKIFKTLAGELDALRSKFSPKDKTASGFTLD